MNRVVEEPIIRYVTGLAVRTTFAVRSPEGVFLGVRYETDDCGVVAHAVKPVGGVETPVTSVGEAIEAILALT